MGVSANVFDAYDAMGRPTQYHQRFWANGAWGQYFNISRAYDKAGHVLTQTNPSGHSVAYGYDIAGRINSDTGNIGDGVSRTYATAVTYSEFGGLQQEQFGTQTPLYHKVHYNVRGQLYDIRLSTSSLQTNEWDWNRGAVVNCFSSNYSWGGNSSGSGTDNNGNLTRQLSYVPANDAITTFNCTQDTFSYDFLNRLQSVSEVPATQAGYGVQAFTQMFNYDRWGNRTIDQNLTSVIVPHPNYTVDTNTNRLIAPAGYSYGYDNAGNQTSDNYTGQGALTYDAENRMKQAWANNQWQTYTYDADGHRIKRNVNGSETWQVYGMAGELLAEYQSGAAPYLPATEYGYRGGELLTTITSGDAQRLSRFVYNLYYGALQRDPTSQELQDATNQLAAAGVQGESQLLTTASQIARSLFTSTSYETSPYRSDNQFVTDLYYAYLQRGPDDSGLNWWAGQVPGSGRANVCNGFEASGEFQTLVATLYGTSTSDNQRTENFVNNFYLGAYGRNATSTELQQQRDALNAAAAQGQSQVQAQAQTLGQALFAAQMNDASLSNTQYVTNLNEAFLQRGPDAAGLGWWSPQASVGQGRQNVLNGFAASTAFQQLAGTLYREANWLVSDQPGTPRMIVNKLGSLSSVKRHDYLPFGEELYAGLGGRTTTQGYTGDSVRQKFTQKERDNETGLDYFGERYYASTMGRFTTADPLGASARVSDPQTMNRYTFVLNNPLRYVDPDGLKEKTPWEQLTDEERKQLTPKLVHLKDPHKISAKELKNAGSRFNSLATAKGDAQATADRIATAKGFVAEFSSHGSSPNNDPAYQQIDQIQAIGRSTLEVTVKNKDDFLNAVASEGYSVNSAEEAVAQEKSRLERGRADHPFDNARSLTYYDTDPELHFANDQADNPKFGPDYFFTHYDQSSVNCLSGCGVIGRHCLAENMLKGLLHPLRLQTTTNYTRQRRHHSLVHLTERSGTCGT